MIYLGLGSNLGDREENLRMAVQMLDDHPDIRVIQVSSIYETAPVGYTEQPAFLNAVVAIETTLTPQALLMACLGIEADLGRVREFRWGPRTIDIDILIFNDITLTSDMLSIPHPFMHTRPFVLIPLAELTGETAVFQSKTAEELLRACDVSEVRLYKPFDWRNAR